MLCRPRRWYGLDAVSGTVGKVGITGLTLGGGYGPLMGRFGLATDNLLGAEVVLADGRLVTADATRESELYWALRGGGGNFGVVTSMRVKLHAPNKLVTGYIMYPWSEAADVLNRFNTWIADAPDELTVQMGIVSANDGSPALMALPAWSGDLDHAQDVIDNLQLLGNPFVSQVGPKTYTEMLSLWEPYVVDGRQDAIRTRSVATYTPDVISALVAAGSTRTSTLSNVYVHHFHGAAARVPINSTAFGVRRNHFMVEIVPGWEKENDDQGARNQAWADSLSEALAADALPGGYAGSCCRAPGPGGSRVLRAFTPRVIDG